MCDCYLIDVYGYYTLSTNDGEYHEGITVFIPALANTSPIRASDGMVCIGSEIAFQTEHPLLWGAGVRLALGTSEIT